MTAIIRKITGYDLALEELRKRELEVASWGIRPENPECRIISLADRIHNMDIETVKNFKEAFLAYNVSAFKRNCLGVVAPITAISCVAYLALGIIASNLAMILPAMILTAVSASLISSITINHISHVANVGPWRGPTLDMDFKAIEIMGNHRITSFSFFSGRDRDDRKKMSYFGGVFWKYFTFNNGENPLQLVHPLRKILPIMRESEFNRIMDSQ